MLSIGNLRDLEQKAKILPQIDPKKVNFALNLDAMKATIIG